MKKEIISVVLVATIVFVLGWAADSWGYLAKASWYGEYFHGRTAANGKPYNMYGLTAAHKTLPLGTIVKITNPQNNQSIIVEITDRGPYIFGREIDLSYQAAKILGLLKKGVGSVEIKILGIKSGYYLYKIRKGDSLSKLFGPNWPIVSRLNKIVQVRKIPKGMVLLVPYHWDEIIK